jgi:hypothetical protein
LCGVFVLEDSLLLFLRDRYQASSYILGEMPGEIYINENTADEEAACQSIEKIIHVDSKSF